MADTALWLVGVSAWTAFISMLLNAAGLLTPWWMKMETAAIAPTVTEVTLWKSNTQWTVTADMEVTRHAGCTYKCDRARLVKPRVISKCQTWDDISEWAGPMCSVGIPSRAESKVTTTTRAPVVFDQYGMAPGQYPQSGYNHEQEASVNQFKNPYLKYEKEGAPQENPAIPISTYRPFEFGFATTTTTLLTSITSTTMTTTNPSSQTLAPTAAPLDTTPQLGGTYLIGRACPRPTPEELSQAPYTPWEQHFDLSLEIMERLYARLNKFFFRVPPYYFTQRPTRMEQVRLVWEVYVQRSPTLKWLGEYQCPSVAAREFHWWVWVDAPQEVRDDGEQAITPPHVPYEVWEDWALKEAWEIEILDITTTTLEAVPDPFADEDVKETSLAPPRPTAEPTSPPDRTPYQPDVAGIFQCHLAKYDPAFREEGPFAWFEHVDSCTMEQNLQKVWVVKGALFLGMVIAMAYCFPAAVLFLGSGQRFAWRFPPSLGFWMSLGSCLFQLIAVISASTIGSPKADEMNLWLPPTEMLPGMNGPGFWCTVGAMVCSFGAALVAKAAQVVLASSVSDEEEEVEAGTVTYGSRQINPIAEQAVAKIAWEQPNPPDIHMETLQPGAVFDISRQATMSRTQNGAGWP